GASVHWASTDRQTAAKTVGVFMARLLITGAHSRAPAPAEPAEPPPRRRFCGRAGRHQTEWACDRARSGIGHRKPTPDLRNCRLRDPPTDANSLVLLFS